MRRARGEVVQLSYRGVVPAPPGIVMVTPPTVPRNVEGAQREGRVGGGRPSTPVQRGQQYKHYKGRSPGEPGSCRIIYALAGGSCISYRGGAIEDLEDLRAREGPLTQGLPQGPACTRSRLAFRGP